MSEKPNDKPKLLEKMRADAEKQQRNTRALPLRRIRKKVPKNRHADQSKPQE